MVRLPSATGSLFVFVSLIFFLRVPDPRPYLDLGFNHF